jgi:hypothetical protein
MDEHGFEHVTVLLEGGAENSVPHTVQERWCRAVSGGARPAP